MRVHWKLKVAAFFVAWFACGAFAYSRELGYYTCLYPWNQNTAFAVGGVFFGPISAGVVVLDGHTGFPLWKPLTTEQRWESFHAQFPTESREDFEEQFNGKPKPNPCKYSAFCPDGER